MFLFVEHVFRNSFSWLETLFKLETFKNSGCFLGKMPESNKSVLLASLFDNKTVEVLKKLMDKKDVFYLRDISRDTGVSLATTFRIVQKLVGLGLVQKVRQDKFTFYTIVRGTPIYNEVSTLIVGSPTDPVQMLKIGLEARYASQFQLFGLEGNDKKLFIVGQSMDEEHVKQLMVKILEQTSVRYDYLVLAPQQFEQMKSIGLISKDIKKV